MKKEELLSELDSMNISYVIEEHKAVYNMEEINNINLNLEGQDVKNLFLKDKKNYFLVSIRGDKRANIKEIAEKIGAKHPSFAKEDDLESLLGVERGSVTPFGIVNDTENKVILAIDKDLACGKIIVHPLVNTASISIDYKDFEKVSKKFNHEIILF